MMTEEQANELGKRAIAAGWKWQPGAVDACGWRCVDVDRHGAWGWFRGSLSQLFDAADIPDFRDPATLGILRQQVIDLVPGAVDLWLIPVPQEMRCLMAWQDSAGERLKESTYFAPDNWHIVALVAALEAHRRQSAPSASEG